MGPSASGGTLMVWGEDWLERWALAAVHACCLLDAYCSLMLNVADWLVPPSHLLHSPQVLLCAARRGAASRLLRRSAGAVGAAG